MKQFPLILLLFLCCSINGFSTNYYFSSSDGDDARSTSVARNPLTPWKTLSKLNAFFSQLLPGDSILFKRGDTFFGSIKMLKSGSDALPIVLSAYGKGQRPIISGFISVSSWKPIGNGIFESDALATAESVNMVVIGGVNYAMGRYPNSNATNKGYLNFESHGSNYILDNQLSSTVNWKNAELVIRTTRWTIERTPITDHSGKQLTYQSNLRNAISDGYGFFIQNHPKTLDQFGEWYYNTATKKISIYFGDKLPSAYSVQVAAINLMLEPKANNLVLDNLNITGANQYGVYCDWANMKNLRIKNTQILFSGIDGVQLSGRTNFVMENCTISNSNSKAINLNYNNPRATLRNNLISKTGVFPGMIVNTQTYAMVSNTKGLIAEYNKITNSGYVGIRFFGDSNLIKNNYIDIFCTVLDDGAGIYTWTGGQNQNYAKRTIIGNIVINGLGAPEGTDQDGYSAAEGIYLDDNSTNLDIIGNTVANCSNNGIFIHNSRNILIQNNTLYNNQIQISAIHDQLGEPISNVSFSNNKLFSKKTDQVNTSLKSAKNDLQNIGNFSGNYYARPLDDDMSNVAENFETNTKQWYDFKGWQATFGKNKDAGVSPMQIKPYTIKSIDLNRNKYTNGGFDGNTSGLYCWSPTNDCSVNLGTTSPLDKRAVKISGSNSGMFGLECGAIDHSKQYILRFSAIAETESYLNIYLMQLNSPWKIISTVRPIKIKTVRSENEILFSLPATEANTAIMFQAVNGKFSYWLDNVGLYEANVSFTNPDDYLRFEFNASTTDKTIFLETSYMDVKKTSYSGKLVLKPYESIVLIKDASKKPGQGSNSKLSNFLARTEDCLVQLDWIAEIYDGFSHFELEKSLDGTIFEPLAKIFRSGEDSYQSFHFVDTQANPTNYYRLKTVDQAGGFEYSDVVQQAIDCPQRVWQLYPSIVTAESPELNIKLYTEKPSILFSLFDQLGRSIKTLQVETLSGWNTIRWSFDHLSEGMYFLRQSDSLLREVLPFVVVKN